MKIIVVPVGEKYPASVHMELDNDDDDAVWCPPPPPGGFVLGFWLGNDPPV
jgi:hypothetical protein